MIFELRAKLIELSFCTVMTIFEIEIFYLSMNQVFQYLIDKVVFLILVYFGRWCWWQLFCLFDVSLHSFWEIVTLQFGFLTYQFYWQVHENRRLFLFYRVWCHDAVDSSVDGLLPVLLDVDSQCLKQISLCQWSKSILHNHQVCAFTASVVTFDWSNQRSESLWVLLKSSSLFRPPFGFFAVVYDWSC